MNNFLKTSSCILALLLSFTFCPLDLRADIRSTNSPAAISPGKQTLLFRNGDVLFGNLESIRDDKSIAWRRSDVPQPIEFSGTNLLEVRFPSAKKPDSPTTNACWVRLHNDDALEGELLQIDSEKITVETTFAGKLIFPRKFVRAIEPVVPQGNLIFSGPDGLDGWTIGKVNAPIGEAGEWRYANGAFYATASAAIARDVKLPDVASIQFDLAWKGMLQAAVALYTSSMQPVNLQSKDTEPDFGGFYSLQINSFTSTLMPVKKGDPLRYFGQIPVPAFNQKNRAHIEIKVNKSRASIALLVDGALVKEWTDTEVAPDGQTLPKFIGTGTAMRFVHQGQGSLKLSGLRIAEWNGKLEEKTTNAPIAKEDLARLLNGDTVLGNLHSFRDGKLKFSINNKELDIPLGRVTEVLLAAEKSEPPVERGTDLRAFFNGGGSVTFRVEKWDEQNVTGTSPNFGRATFSPAAFERVQLNSISTNKIAQTPGKIIFK